MLGRLYCWSPVLRTEKVKPNPYGLPDFMMNRVEANLPELLEDWAESGTRYACDYWATRIWSSPTVDDPPAAEFF